MARYLNYITKKTPGARKRVLNAQDWRCLNEYENPINSRNLWENPRGEFVNSLRTMNPLFFSTWILNVFTAAKALKKSDNKFCCIGNISATLFAWNVRKAFFFYIAAGSRQNTPNISRASTSKRKLEKTYFMWYHI